MWLLNFHLEAIVFRFNLLDIAASNGVEAGIVSCNTTLCHVSPYPDTIT